MVSNRIKKCSCIVFGNIDTSDVQYINNNQHVNTVSEVRDFNVIVDSSLKFYSHISYIVAKANALASLNYKCFVSRNPEIMHKKFTSDHYLNMPHSFGHCTIFTL